MNKVRLSAPILFILCLGSVTVSPGGYSIVAQESAANSATILQSRTGPIARFTFNGTM